MPADNRRRLEPQFAFDFLFSPHAVDVLAGIVGRFVGKLELGGKQPGQRTRITRAAAEADPLEPLLLFELALTQRSLKHERPALHVPFG